MVKSDEKLWKSTKKWRIEQQPRGSTPPCILAPPKWIAFIVINSSVEGGASLVPTPVRLSFSDTFRSYLFDLGVNKAAASSELSQACCSRGRAKAGKLCCFKEFPLLGKNGQRQEVACAVPGAIKVYTARQKNSQAAESLLSHGQALQKLDRNLLG